MAVSFKVVKCDSNPLLSRKEVELVVTHRNQGTPKKELIASELSSNYAVPTDRIYVYGIKTRFGLHESRVKAHMYNSTDDLKKIERAFVVSRMTGVVPAKIKRTIKKQERRKKNKMFGTDARRQKKAQRRLKD